MVLNRLLRSSESLVDLGRNSGGLEFLRGGYAKCILDRRRAPEQTGLQWA